MDDCDQIYNPVCSSSDITFKNECVLKCESQTLKHYGECKRDVFCTCSFLDLQLVCGVN